mmetsp:Transcript_35082/g.56752  ORF Transcript_35082/g.56752 Transcript_35082/m.56752 type:complete len:166 (-) Transcript_35082:824-1321(-)|eukprot:CAMPEP_0184671762 /NCGR_PEP_ID=MMETSP0308-20130426/85692_1 /TAXON_ID=38269 /ORGANISM="Gloeochaete witrockiana, Strain SAG 46.84" /LENGTH=165 /DNA_ID=CAMNT_0027118951 /DNA_START=802 /DNA_END=1299 /DNA_ORIENTATION=-
MTGKRKSLEGTSDAKDEPTIESLPDNVLFRIIEKAKAGCESPLLINYIASVNKRFRSITNPRDSTPSSPNIAPPQSTVRLSASSSTASAPPSKSEASSLPPPSAPTSSSEEAHDDVPKQDAELVNTAAEEVMRKETSLDETTDPLALSRLTITSGSVSKMEVMDG